MYIMELKTKDKGRGPEISSLRYPVQGEEKKKVLLGWEVAAAGWDAEIGI